MTKTCKHKWELTHTKWEYPDTSNTATSYAEMVEVAYLFCQKCQRVKKVLVEQVKESK